MKGLVFHVEEFAVFDGPGLRTAVFLKGCPLRCNWCHNPEGLEMRVQRLKNEERCAHCGACERACPNPGQPCTACGRCLPACRQGLLSLSGEWMEASELAGRLLRNRALLQGVSFTGGEALLQPDFMLETISLLDGLHCLVETCGHVPSRDFRRVCAALDMVYFDVKLADSQQHRRYTGQGNELILENLAWLKREGPPFVARVPLIPGVNDGADNLEATAALLEGAPRLLRVELLPYNKNAGAKYSLLSLAYRPAFDESRPVNADIAPFTRHGLEARVL